MHIHIVAIEWKSSQILARHIRELLEIPGFTVGKKPNPKADINYFYPYLLGIDFPDFNSTPLAAYFTHHDTYHSKRKGEMWVEVAERVDLRITNAQRNIASIGEAHIALPPIELEKFVPVDRPSNPVPVVGVSGYVYKGGRKGEDLVAQLAQSELGQRIKLVASGKGWPIPTKEYRWVDLQKFYQSLDVFLCTSLAEGIPMPPLEAIACGVPCVLPHGVGLIDDLELLDGSHPYYKGNYEDMIGALEYVLGQLSRGETVDISDYRRVANQFTPDRFRNDHIEIFEEFFCKPLSVDEHLPDWRDCSGVYFVAFGEPARACAKTAMESWRKYMPEVEIMLVSTSPIGIEDWYIEEEDKGVGARWIKTQIETRTPEHWKYVLFMDADTVLVNPVPFLLDLLQVGWEFFMCVQPDRYVLLRDSKRPDNRDEIDETSTLVGTDEVLQLNGGVFGYRRNERTRELMAKWYSEWDRYGKRDQASFTRLLYTSPLRIYVLGQEWNTVIRADYNDPERTAGILHYPMTARRHKGIIMGRNDSKEAWNKVKEYDGRTE